MKLLASPASLKGVFSPREAAALLASGMRRVEGVEAIEAPVADGGEGTAEVIQAALGGEWRTAVVADPLGRTVAARWLLLDDGTAVVDSAAALGLPLLLEEERDPLRASSRGLGELLLATLAARPTSLLVGVGGVATVDGGVGMRGVVGSWLHDIPMRVACDVRNPLLGERGAARVFAPQKGADADDVEELELRLAALEELAAYRDLRGAGAGGGLGAAFAAMGAELLDGAELVLDITGFDERAAGAALVVTGEGTVDATTFEGKAPGAVLRRCRALGVHCELFGGIVREGYDAHALSGRRALAGEDIVQLGEELALTL
ncbi:MAG: glycerate 2-kinase [Candidatus Eremiobacteraeota bacterium]|jgi:glycerate kinase|nr:glycerate 2-kinase [Candidatus Eremiobacteraeota bacterium]